jgi:hypothetical protein
MGQDLWPGLVKPAAEKAEQGEAREARGPQYGLEADAAMSAALWPEKKPTLPDRTEGQVNLVVRDTSGGDREHGRILCQGTFERVDQLVQRNAPLMDNACLAGEQIALEVRDGSMRMADMADLELTKDGALISCDLRGCDARGAQLHGSLAHSDCRGMDVDETTDISGSDWLNVKLDRPTFEKLRECKGFTAAKHLVKPVE